MGRKAVAVVLVMLGVAFLAAPMLAQSPLQVTISGTSRVILWGTSTRYASWSTTVSGGVPPYQYQWFWNGNAVTNGFGTGSSFGGTYQGPGQDKTWTDVVSVIVRDAYGQTASDDHTISGTAYASDPFGTPRN